MVHSWKCRNWIWLVAGTEDGVWAARQLLALSVPVRVQVVSPGACRAYGLLTANPAFQCRAMALTPREVHRVLTGPAPPALVLDATHPFALRITRTLHTACGASAIPYLRLHRPQLKPGAATLVDRLEAVQDLGSRSLLTAIGSRNLAPLVAWHGPQRTAAPHPAHRNSPAAGPGGGIATGAHCSLATRRHRPWGGDSPAHRSGHVSGGGPLSPLGC